MNLFSKYGRGRVFSAAVSDGIFPLFLVLVLGMGFGCMASSRLIWDGYLSLGAFGRCMVDSTFFFVLLFMSTTWLGFALVPLLSFVRGFLMAALCASAFSFSGLGIIGLLIKAALPSVLMLPAFFMLAEDSRRISFSLFEMKFGRGRSFCGTPLLFHLAFTIICLFFDFVYHAYIF